MKGIKRVCGVEGFPMEEAIDETSLMRTGKPGEENKGKTNAFFFFSPGKRGTDDVILIQELTFKLKHFKGVEDACAIKLDLEKVYDKLEWSFPYQTLLFFNFPLKHIRIVMACISFYRVAILHNGSLTD
ncbi:hypothetical protein ACH5RR_012128 [Cinchona calisaya]|uniref:Reverse transcriptase n=1 Tax=Cinchona calisaya TaxID=153742 RepID=A0ABD3A6Y4_9GENT